MPSTVDPIFTRLEVRIGLLRRGLFIITPPPQVSSVYSKEQSLDLIRSLWIILTTTSVYVKLRVSSVESTLPVQTTQLA